MEKIPLIVIAGATASGKTSLSIQLAHELDGEIVSADSMQIYKYMDIGTAKPDLREREGIPHHMIDIVTPDTNFSVADYTTMAHDAIADIYRRGKMPIMVGGTGLYISSVVNDVDFAEGDDNSEIRKELFALAEEKGKGYLHKMLEEIDPASAEKIHENNLKRVIRAIEIYRLSGEKLSEHNQKSKEKESRYEPVMMQIVWDREVLYERINKRVDIMIEAGLEAETKKLYNMGYASDLTAMQGIGYKEMFEYFNGSVTFDEAVEKIKQGSRNYAKRQNTWFKRDERIVRLSSEENIFKNAIKLIRGEI